MNVGRVIAGVSGSPGSLQVLRYATDVARSYEAPLIPVLAWLPPGGDLADRRFPCSQLREAWADAAWQRLWAAIDLSLGGPPAELDFQPAIARGELGSCWSTPPTRESDLLVIGTGRRGAVGRLAGCHVNRYCLAHAHCPVIAVPPPALADVAHGVRGWAWRHRRLDSEAARLHSAGA